MKLICINCRAAELRKDTVQLTGKFRGQDYTVEMSGLKCPNCGYMTAAGEGIAEFGKLLSEQYKSANNLLTSKAIVELRRSFDDSQDAFARRTGVSPASIKRYELGKIQDRHIDDQIREKTKTPVNEVQQYSFPRCGTVSSLWAGCSNAISYSTQHRINNIVTQQDAPLIGNQNWLWNIAATVPPYIANWRIRGDNDRDTASSATEIHSF